MNLSDAVNGYLLDIQTNYSQTTVTLYRMLLPKLIQFLGDPYVEDITLQDLQRFIQHLQTSYIPVRPGGDRSKLSPSAIDNYWKSLRSFFGWASETLSIQRPDAKLARPKYKLPEVIPFTEAEIQRMLHSCEYVDVTGIKTYRRRRPTANRDRAIILTLLDTGLRIGELCRLKIQDVNLETGEVLVAPFGGGQKTKPRIVFMGKTARRQLWLYLAKDRAGAKPTESLFDQQEKTVRSMMRYLEKRTGINNVHCHRFRHTAAILFLRNGGDLFSLQKILGHSSLEMVRHYLALSKADVENAHRRASPVDNWNLK